MNKHVLRCMQAILSLACAGTSLQAAAQTSNVFPSRPVTIVVPYPAGGGTDSTARAMAHALSQRWKQTVVVENIGGGDGIIGTQRALRAPADGHTILFQLASSMVLWPTLNPGQGDLVPELKFLSIVQRAPIAFAVRSDFPASNIKEFAAWCKAHSCSAGAGTSHAKLVMQSLLDTAGLSNTVTIGYKGGHPMLNDLLGGHISIGTPSAAAVQAQLKAGTIKFLAVGSKERFAGTPGVPTLTESGYPILAESVYGVMVAKATPAPIAKQIADAVRSLAADATLQALIKKNVAQPVFGTPEEFEEHMKREAAYLEPLARKHLVSEK